MKSIAVFGAAAIAAAAFLAPATGFAQEAAAAAAETSRVCFNPALYAEGAVLDYDSVITGSGAGGSYRTVATTKAKARFNGVLSIPIETQTYDEDGEEGELVTGYVDYTSAFLMFYGSKSRSGEVTFDPASQEPINRGIDKPYRQTVTVTVTPKRGPEQTTERKTVWTFAGFEERRLPVGKFRLCKFTLRSTDSFMGFSTVSNQTIYVAAEGRYRGFPLRTKISTKLPTGVPIVSTTDVTEIRKFPR